MRQERQALDGYRLTAGERSACGMSGGGGGGGVLFMVIIGN